MVRPSKDSSEVVVVAPTVVVADPTVLVVVDDGEVLVVAGEMGVVVTTVEEVDEGPAESEHAATIRTRDATSRPGRQALNWDGSDGHLG